MCCYRFRPRSYHGHTLPKLIGLLKRQYYERKTAEGKHPLCVINAVKNKLVLRGAAIIKSQKPFVDNFVKLNEATKNVT